MIAPPCVDVKDECVDCGACEPVCPLEAIDHEDAVPERWSECDRANVELVDDLGSRAMPRRWA